MCGIVGILSGTRSAITTQSAIEAISKLEYRGYDSAGIAVNSEGSIKIKKTIKNIAEIKSDPISQLESKAAIAHTRWATHGEVNEANAHPQYTEKVAVVHNGMIDNYAELMNELVNNGYKSKTDTDSEVIVMLIDWFLSQKYTKVDAFAAAIAKLKGSFAIIALFKDCDHFLGVAKNGAPLVIGYSDNMDTIIASSDIVSFPSEVLKYIKLIDGDLVYMTMDKIGNISVINNQLEAERSVHVVPSQPELANDMGGYDSYTLKEIFQQPEMIAKFVAKYTDSDGILTIQESIKNLENISKIIFIASGSSYNAALSGVYYFEKNYKLASQAYVASDVLSREMIWDGDKTLYVLISQSGETRDGVVLISTLKNNKCKFLAITNTPNSTMGTLCETTIQCNAGVEVGVAATKTFTAQLLAIFTLGQNIFNCKKQHKIQDSCKLLGIENGMRSLLQNNKISLVAKEVCGSKSFLFIGRELGFALAMEAALKLKELSYVSTEGIHAGELKHGSLALIDEKVTVFAIVPDDRHIERNLSNIEEVMSRKGSVVLISKNHILEKLGEKAKKIKHHIALPEVESLPEFLSAIAAVQLIAYHIASCLGNNVDRPRNLAKSVTVE